MKDKVRIYTVECSIYSEFPIDMLRHDDAKPVSADDNLLVERLNSRNVDAWALEGRKTVLIKLQSSWRGAPNVKRWESFGCKVVECDDPIVRLSNCDPDEERVKLLRRLSLTFYRYGTKADCAIFGMAVTTVLREAQDCATRDLEHRERVVGQVMGVRSTLLCVSTLYNDIWAYAALMDAISHTLVTRTLGEVNSMRDQVEQAIEKLRGLKPKAA